MKVLILAAGRGSRISSETKFIPKCMIEINGKSLLEGICENFESNKLKDINIVTGYLANKIHDERINKKFYNPRWSDTNMVASMLVAKELFECDDVLVSYSDIFYSPKVIKTILEENSDFDIALSYDVNFIDLWSKRFKNPLDDLESFQIDEYGFVREIGNKPASLNEIHGQYMGILLFKKKSWPIIYDELISTDYSRLSMTEFIGKLIKKKFKIKAIPYHDRWGEVDTIDDKNLYKSLNF